MFEILPSKYCFFPFYFSKESSSDLLSRYKARKMLGVGESSGNVVSSKVSMLTDIIGINKIKNLYTTAYHEVALFR